MIKPSILKRPTTAYLSVEETNPDSYTDGNKGLSLKFSPANSNTNSQKNVRFSGVEFRQLQAPVQLQRHQRNTIYSQPKEEANREDFYELEKATQFPNEIGLKKYYKKSKTVPVKQIKLVGLNDEFIVASQPIQRHIQRELQQQQQQQQQMTQRSTSSTKSKAQLRTTSARPFSDNYNRSLMYPNVFRVAPSANQTPKVNSQQSTNNTNNCFYEQSNITVSSFQSPNNRPNNYYHWQSSENSTKSPNCENNQQPTSNPNPSSLNHQHNKIISIMSNQQSPTHTAGQLKSSLVKMNSKKTRNKNNLSSLFSPTSSMQSYGTYKTISISNASENALENSSLSNASASQFAASNQQQHLYQEQQQQQQASLKNPSSLTLYTYLLESSKANNKEGKTNVVRSQTKKINYEQVYMKNLVPKIQKLDIKNQGRSANSNSSGTSAVIRNSINPVDESPSTYSTKPDYKIFTDPITRPSINMKLRSESASS